MSLTDRERRQLAQIERRLVAEEPRLADRLARPLDHPRVHVTLPLPAVLLVVGLLLLVVGGVAALLPVMVTGAALAVAAPALVASRRVRTLRLAVATHP